MGESGGCLICREFYPWQLFFTMAMENVASNDLWFSAADPREAQEPGKKSFIRRTEKN